MQGITTIAENADRSLSQPRSLSAISSSMCSPQLSSKSDTMASWPPAMPKPNSKKLARSCCKMDLHEGNQQTVAKPCATGETVSQTWQELFYQLTGQELRMCPQYKIGILIPRPLALYSVAEALLDSSWTVPVPINTKPPKDCFKGSWQSYAHSH